MPAKKTGLPRVRKFLKRMPQLAFRGTTLENIPKEVSISENEREISITPNFFLTARSTFSGKTRNIVERLYNSAGIALGRALKYAGVKIEYGPENRVFFTKPKKTPVIMLVANPKKAQKPRWQTLEESENFFSTSIALVRGANAGSTIPYTPGLLFERKARTLQIKISRQDLDSALKAWNKHFEKNRQALEGNATAIRLNSQSFIYNFLIRRIVQKALPFIREGMSTSRKRS